MEELLKNLEIFFAEWKAAGRPAKYADWLKFLSEKKELQELYPTLALSMFLEPQFYVTEVSPFLEMLETYNEDLPELEDENDLTGRELLNAFLQKRYEGKHPWHETQESISRGWWTLLEKISDLLDRQYERMLKLANEHNLV